MPFPFGRPVLVLAAVAVASGVAVVLRPARPAARLTVWSFTPADAAADRDADRTARVDLIAAAAIDVRLSSMFMAGGNAIADAARPDVVELEVNGVGKLLCGPAADIGFCPLDDDLRRGGWASRIPSSLLAPYSRDGHPYGVPVAVHPVALVYRSDRIDLSRADTWPAVQAECLRYQHSHAERWAMALPAAAPDVLLVLLQQRHVTLVDVDGTAHLTDPAVADTVCWYAAAAAGTDRIGTDPNPAPGGLAADLSAGTVVAAVVADWMVADLKRAAPELAGTLTLRPLPRFDPADARTATWGGTMAAIPRFCPDPDHAWAWVESAYFSPAAIARRWQRTGSIPPLPDAWADPMFHRPDPFFTDRQRAGELFVTLAGELPPRSVTPYTTTAQNLLAYGMDRAVAHVRGGRPNLRPAVDRWLADRQAQLRRLVAFDRVTGRSSAGS